MGDTEAHPIHAFLAERADPQPGEIVVDLGCGRGPTLAALARRCRQAKFVGVDLDAAALEEARAALDPTATAVRLLAANLCRPLPCLAGRVDVAVCHNVLELLPDPAILLADVARLLRPGGRAIVSHTDFDALVLNSRDAALTRRVLHGYADLQQPWMTTCDGWMGRRLPGLLHAAPLQLTDVTANTVVETRYRGLARRRITEVVAVLRAADRRGAGPVAEHELDAWQHDLLTLEKSGEFCFAETAFVATAYRA